MNIFNKRMEGVLHCPRATAPSQAGRGQVIAGHGTQRAMQIGESVSQAGRGQAIAGHGTVQAMQIGESVSQAGRGQAIAPTMDALRQPFRSMVGAMACPIDSK